ncbi:MAG: Glu-tRNA(Gln) amidotransferase GatDE subunit E [Thermoplasmata archaeon HGW-Thermoplasmata-1]|nr:MAG: Glu-tRNA(Gln) amidotransferase GatDE subunit E [Thermoplasmata archaeon HGW-Thermoplasmata-1]
MPQDYDYAALGFRAGLEIHQQLDTAKLFCSCASEITEDIDYEFQRLLRPTQSEMGDVDRAAIAEAKKKRRFIYTASKRTTCMVEADEEPPHEANGDAIDVALTMAELFCSRVVDEMHFMRKIVIDGSNTSGFQRTGLVAFGGMVDEVRVQTIALEEDSARKIGQKDSLVNYGLDRLGIPLLEIATEPDIRDPRHAQDVAKRIGRLLRATKKVKRGLGTIRQDVNVSISGGARVEIKGVQNLKAMPEVARKEVERQLMMLAVKAELEKRGITKDAVEACETIDLTAAFSSCESKVVRASLDNNGAMIGVRLPGFEGLIKGDYREGPRLGRELSGYAKNAAGVKGVFHSDELPSYGITENEVTEVKRLLSVCDGDGFVICAEARAKALAAVTAARERAVIALEGVAEEVRKALPDDSTEYMRPMPGAARMYPETDVPPVAITAGRRAKIRSSLPELPEAKMKRFVRDYALNRDQAKQLFDREIEDEYEAFVTKYPSEKNAVARILLNVLPELELSGLDTSVVDGAMVGGILDALSQGGFAKEAVPQIMNHLLKNPGHGLAEAVSACGVGAVGEDEVTAVIRAVILERAGFVKQKGMDALGPLMGPVMEKLRGKADGALISKVLKEELKRAMGSQQPGR